MGLRGSLSELKLPDLIELMTAGVKTGLVIIAGEDGSGGELGFVDGVLVSARAGSLTGERAFFALLDITRGSFLVDAAQAPAGRDVTVSVQSLLMEGMRRLDEVGELRQRLPGSARVMPGCEGAATDDLEAHLIAVVAAREQTVQEIVRLFAAAGRADEYECLQTLQRLLDRAGFSFAPEGAKDLKLNLNLRVRFARISVIAPEAPRGDVPWTTLSISSRGPTMSCVNLSRSSRLRSARSRVDRRILQGKLDILHAELVMRLQRKHNEGESVISTVDLKGLSRILAGQTVDPSVLEQNAEDAKDSEEA